MAWQPFVLGLLFGGPTHGVALGAYRPLLIKNDAGERVRNPAFDKHSQQVLNLKSPERPNYFKPAIEYCTESLAAYLRENVPAQNVEILIMPSCTKGKISAGLEKVVQEICRKDKRFVYHAGSLARTKTIEKLAKGGDRSVGVHLSSLEYKPRNGAPLAKILLDDVMTTGNSLIGAITVIHQVQQNAAILPIVFGKTTHD